MLLYLKFELSVLPSTTLTLPNRACYVAVAFYVAGFVLQGAAFQMHFHIAVLVVGWILAEVAVMLNTSAICEHSAARSSSEGSLTRPLLRCLLQRLLPHVSGNVLSFDDGPAEELKTC